MMNFNLDPVKWLGLDGGDPGRGLNVKDLREAVGSTFDVRNAEARHFAENLDEYDLVAWACELVGFDHKDVGAVHVYFDKSADKLIVEVALMDEWVPDYEVPLYELVDRTVPIPPKL